MIGKEPYNFTDKTSSDKGIVGFWLSVIGLLLLLVIICKSAIAPITMIEGLVGIYAFFIGMIAICFCIYSFKEEETKSGVKVVATILSILVIVASGGLFFLGM